MRPRSRLTSIEEAAEASQQEAARAGLGAVAASGGDSGDDEEPDAEEPEASPSPGQVMPPLNGRFCLPGEEAEVTRLDSEFHTPPVKCLWNTPFAWAAALEQGDCAKNGGCATDILKPWKWEAQPEAYKPELPLTQRTGGCTLPPVGVSALHWVNQEDHLIVQLSPQKVLVAVFDGHGEEAALAARCARFLFEQQAAACLEQPGVLAAEGLRKLFEAVHEDMVNEEALTPATGASVAAAVVDAKSQTATIAHVGDPKVMIANRWGVVEFETVQHFADAGALACHAEPPDKIGGLAARCRAPRAGVGCTGLWVAHGLGDWEAGAGGVRAAPSVTSSVPLGPESTLLVATGSVWEMVRKEAAVHYASTGPMTPEASALSVLRQARSEQSRAGYAARGENAGRPDGSSGVSLAAVIVRGGSY